MKELKTAVQRVVAGQTYLSQPFDEDDIRMRQLPVKRLSPREEQILHLIASGHSMVEIAELLGVSLKTVMSHRANIREKLQLPSVSALLNYAVADWRNREQ